ncbi:MAG: hypothetical protein ACKO0Z_06025 [Betaproteobacteria bacterium]
MKGKKTGGRTKGTPNKDTPQKKAIKAILLNHSLAYITPHDVVDEETGEHSMLSQLDMDLALMKAADRAQIEVKLMEFHTPKMQSTSVDVNMPDTKVTIEDKLLKLSQEPEEEE